MSIEIRQLLIRTQVQPAPPPEAAGRQALPARELQRLREQLLAECKTWLADRLRTHGER
ncbi:DUF5908 family protein [Roseateles sp. SL47]|jgi:Family of unknown function (DUF5908)|uniref:DUF5908 family protein n=1 Tax=Roseateles sp. SL47 TaxID=2995138 RepID=UPI00226FEE04|nr:DUF5908 family protein [Roseateles sp. SL47]WAC71479.1 DUF5908 family protein [Roseateles sp. SL47]